MSKHAHQTEIFASLIITLIFLFTYYCNSNVEGSYEFYYEFVPLSQTGLQEFRSHLNEVVDESQQLTKSYQDKIGKWISNQYDNFTLISITDSFIPKFESLINSANNITYPKEYKYIHDALVNSLESETDSYRHFRNYLVTGNKTEDEISTDLLSLAFQYEQIYSKFLSIPLPNSDRNITKFINFSN
jgi:hypothetical protein